MRLYFCLVLSISIIATCTLPVFAQDTIAGCLAAGSGFLYFVRVADTPAFAYQPGDTATIAGFEGLFTLMNACDAEFPGSRMCTSREVTETTELPVISSGPRAWVQPVRILPDGRDISGAVSASGELSCQGWRVSIASGLAVDRRGQFMGSLNCGSPSRVACCAPAQ